MFNATFNNISAISWRSVFLVEETSEKIFPAVKKLICESFCGEDDLLSLITVDQNLNRK